MFPHVKHCCVQHPREDPDQDQEGGDLLRPPRLPSHQLERPLGLAAAGDHRQAGGGHHRGQPGEEGGARGQSDQGGLRELEEQVCPAELPQRRRNKVFECWNTVVSQPLRNTLESPFLKRYQKTCLPPAT